ncbi:hypothetical protein IV102_26490 [bacterium]|nr:hypothetical protein [bacterium]
MQISSSHYRPGSPVPSLTRPPTASQSTPPLQDQVELGGGLSKPGDFDNHQGNRPGWGQKFQHGAFKTGMILGGLALGGLTAVGISSIGASLGLISVGLGLLAQTSDSVRIKMAGALLMLGPVAGAAGALGALGSAFSWGVGIQFAADYGGSAHQLANDLLERRA